MTPEIKSAFDKLTPENRAILMSVRQLILDLSVGHSEIGTLTETLKWSEPAYLTEATKAGSTLRLGQTRSDLMPAIFVNCQTTLIEDFQQLYPETFEYRDNRALVIVTDLEKVIEPLKECIALTLTYHARKHRNPVQQSTVRQSKLKRSSIRDEDVRSNVVRLVEALPEAEAIGKGNHLSFEVRGKRFGWYLDDHHGDGRVAINCKALRGLNQSMSKTFPQRYHVPKYVGHHGWIGLWLDVNELEWNEVENLLNAAYLLTAPKSLVTQFENLESDQD